MTGTKIETGSSEVDQAIVSLLREHARGVRKKQRRGTLKLMGMFLLGGLAITYAAWIWFQAQGRTMMPLRDHVAVIEIAGMIGGPATSQRPGNINSLVGRAFRNESTRAVLLHIRSGGGHPEAADRMGKYARMMADRHNKPLIAHIDGLGASAAYLLAVHADQIYISKYSMTGSVGAVLTGLKWAKLAERWGIEQKTYASSPFKTAMSPWADDAPQSDVILQGLVDRTGSLFAQEVIERRGEKLKMGRDEVARALVYLAPEARALGLVDDIMTIDEVIDQEIGFPAYRMEHRRNLYEQLLVATRNNLEAFIGDQGGIR